jgi:hypothetical protein
MKRSLGVLAAAVLVLPTSPLSAQSELTATCREMSGEPQRFCYAVAQAAESAQPQLGVLIAGGNPTLGTATASGLRLPTFGLLPRMSASVKGNVVFVRLPDVLARQAGGTAAQVNRALGVPAPALSGTASVQVFPGINPPVPFVGGVGSVDLLGVATWLPFRTFSVNGFEDGPQDVSLGFGARLGLVRESFVLPGVSVSLMRHRLGEVRFGSVCPDGEFGSVCPPTSDAGDVGEFAFDVTNWSSRLIASKRLFGMGLTAGVGTDRVSSDVDFAFRYDLAGTTQVRRVRDVALSESRTSAFVNGSFTLLLATVAAEAGWQRGGTPLDGFDAEASDFDPRRGTFFGSLGVRVSF